MHRLLGPALLVVFLVIQAALLHAQVTHRDASLSVSRVLSRVDQVFSVGVLHFTADKDSDLEKFLAAKVGRGVTVTVR